MTPGEPVLCSLACDYITGVTLEKSEGVRLHAVATEMFRVERDFGNEPRPWGLSGFKGWSCGSVDLGARDDEFMLRLSGEAAARSWRAVAEASNRVTRYDVQATVMHPGGPTREINRVRRCALKHSAKHDEKPIVRRIDDNRGGYTLYLGARESNVFARVYDKFAREKLDHFRNCVRYEVQFNKRLARIVCNTFQRSSSPMPLFAGHLKQFFAARDVDLELPYDDSLTFCLPRKASDADRKLLWLAGSVRPSVLSLIALGRGAEALEALGLVSGADSNMVQLDHDNSEEGD